jgi:hypothetical protein
METWIYKVVVGEERVVAGVVQWIVVDVDLERKREKRKIIRQLETALSLLCIPKRKQQLSYSNQPNCIEDTAQSSTQEFPKNGRMLSLFNPVLGLVEV